MKVKVLTILPVLGHPRDSKRVSMLQEQGFDVEVCAFERDYHKGRVPDCQIHILGKVEHGKYLKRLISLSRSVFRVRRLIKENNVIYTSGSDMAYLAVIASVGLKKPVIIEIGDIRELQVSDSIAGRLYRKLDKWFVVRCSLLVSTAQAFIDEYYDKWLGVTINSLVIENKLEPTNVSKKSIKSLEGNPLVDRPLRIGYFGLLRDYWSIEVLIALASSNKINVEVLLAGIPLDSTKEILSKAEKTKGITYFGKYRSPQDLPHLYNSVDMVWACYPEIGPNDWNLRWARPNRFYESCFFETPFFSRVGCKDALDVKKHEIGFLVYEHGIDKVVNSISLISPSELLRWRENISNLSKDVYLYTNESEKLSKAIMGLLLLNLILNKNKRTK
jgi:succinoglycan biosynthesis protein ExoL